ncbi:MAG: class I SAM-dependent methyltransferase [Candidatus Curtissbacteria bacterium]|nr:class I SAM-dependent methyltransferase [Candidatus Curtissbacteria bacterium]
MTKAYIKFNKPLPLVDYLLPLIGDKKEVKIVDVGSGPFSMIGSYLPGIKVEIYHCDKQDFSEYWGKRQLTSVISVEQQNMEKLTYPDGFFDIVHCLNALDHTKNAKESVKEMIRVCKVGGWVYINCALDQLSTGYLHHWNAKQDGIFTNNTETFDLKDFGFQIQFINNGGESRYNQIICTLQKKELDK